MLQVSFRHSECAFNISAITILVPSVAEMTKNRRPPPVSRAIVTRKENTNKFECLFHIENDLSAVGIVFYEVQFVNIQLDKLSFFVKRKLQYEQKTARYSPCFFVVTITTSCHINDESRQSIFLCIRN